VRRLVSFSAGLLLLYCALAVAAFWTAWRDPTDRWIGGSIDPILFIWSLDWIPFALTHGHDPLVTNFAAYPHGINVMWNTTVPLAGLVLTPVTLLLGAVFSYNVLATLAPALSAWCAYFALRRYARPVPAAVGGLLYGFGPYTFAQQDHPQIALAVFPPIVLLLLDEILVRQRRSPVAMGLLLSLATVVQLLIGEEMAAITALLATVGVVLLTLMNRSAVRQRLRYAVRALSVAVGVGLVFAAYPLGVQFFGSGRLHRTVQLPNTFVVDLLELVVPTGHQEVHFGAADRAGLSFTGPSEIDGYVGIPLLLLAVFVAVRYRRERVVRFAAVFGLVAAILSFGPRLHVHGQSLSLRLPWVLPQRLPLLENILPARIAIFTLLAVALLVAVFVDRVRLPRAAVAAIVAAAFVPVFPNLPFLSQSAATPAFFEHGAKALPNGSVAIVAPLAGLAAGEYASRPMLWQVAADFHFKMPGAYAMSGQYSRLPLLVRITEMLGGARPPLTGRDLAGFRCDVVRLHAQSVIVGPMSSGRRAVVELFSAVLARRPEETGGVQLWRNALASARAHAGNCA
jgi:hypothetical protein